MKFVARCRNCNLPAGSHEGSHTTVCTGTSPFETPLAGIDGYSNRYIIERAQGHYQSEYVGILRGSTTMHDDFSKFKLQRSIGFHNRRQRQGKVQYSTVHHTRMYLKVRFARKVHTLRTCCIVLLLRTLPYSMYLTPLSLP